MMQKLSLFLMRRGRPLKPVISIETVLAVLKTLDYNSEADSSTQPLANLMFIREHLQKSGRPNAEGIRTLVIGEWLVDCITSTVNNYRSYFELEPVELDSTRAKVLCRLGTTFETSSQAMKGWHVLFVRYVRPELGFTVTELADIAHTHVRSLQRYQDRAIVALRDQITQAEWAARNRNHQTELRQSIPLPFVDMVGRNDETNAIINYIETSNALPILITGAYGSGKSSLAADVASYLISEHFLDHVLWLARPSSIQVIQNRVWDILDSTPAQTQWHNLLGESKLLLVLDGIDQLGDLDREWQHMLLGLKDAIVILTGVSRVVMPIPSYRVVLESLSESDSLELIKKYTSKLDGYTASRLVQATGGNPAQLISACQSLLDGAQYLEAINTSFRDTVLDAMFASEKLDMFFACLSPCFRQQFSKFPLHKNVLSETTSLAFQTYYEAEAGFQQQVVERIANFIKTSGDSAYIQHTLLDIAVVSWVNLPGEIQVNILKCITLDSLSFSQLQQWRYVFSQIPSDKGDSIEIAYHHCIVLRKCYRYTEAQANLEILLQQLGKTGDFVSQLDILLELGMIAQMTGKFTVAKEIYERVSGLANEYSVDNLEARVRVQLVRLAIENSDHQMAIKYLEQQDLTEPEYFTLFAEAKLLSGDLEFVTMSVKSHLMDQHLPDSVRASLCTVIGRALIKLNEVGQAILYFNQAVILTEQHGGLFDIGRARSNLCGAEIRQLQASSVHDIEYKLKSIARLQSRIHDAVGLEATLRTLKYVRQAFK